MVIHGSFTRDIIILYVCTVHFLLRIWLNCCKLFNKIKKRVTVYIALVKLPCFFLPFFLFCSKCSKHFGIGYLEVKMYFFFIHSFIVYLVKQVKLKGS